MIPRGVTVAALAALAVIVGLAGALVWQSGRLERARRAAADAALAEANAVARADTTRALADGALAAARAVYGDSVAAVTRLVVQATQERDALDRALGQDRRALAEIRAVVAKLRAERGATAPAADDSSGVRRATFDVREAPYTARAVVALAPPGRPASASTIALDVALDTATLALRLGCEDANARGLRAARATLTGPPWLTATLARVEQDPGVCPDVTEDVTRPGWLERLIGADRLTFGPMAGAVRTPEGWRLAWGVGGMVRVVGIP